MQTWRVRSFALLLGRPSAAIAFEPSVGSRVPNPGTWPCLRFRSTSASPQNNFASANIRPDGSFVIDGINGPRRLEVTTTPPGWTLKEIRGGGIDVTDQVLPFGTADESLRDVEVVLTDRVSELMRSVRDDRARPMPFATIVVFSTDRSHWHSRSRFLQRGQTEADGSFSIAGPRPATITQPRCAWCPPTARTRGRNRRSWNR